MKNQYKMPCNIAQTLNIIGDRWSLLILHELLIGHDTYSELRERLDGIPTNLLSERLKTLETDGLLVSALYQEHPPRYHYRLTESGADLGDVFNALILWGERHLARCHKQLVHAACGHPVSHRYHCAFCGEPVDADALTVADTKDEFTVK